MQVFWVLFIGILAYTAAAYLSGKLMGKSGIVFPPVALVLPMILFFFRHRIRPIPFFHAGRPSFRIYLAGAVLIIGFIVIMDEFKRLLQDFVIMDEALLEGIRSLMIFESAGEFAFLFTGAVILAPAAEELLFRGFVQGALQPSYGQVKSILVSTVCFTVLHFQPWDNLHYFLMGLISAIVYDKTKSVFPCFLIHAVHNLVVLLFINAESRTMQGYNFHGHVSPLWMFMAVLMLYAGIRYILNLQKTEKKTT